jgi:hypothetical protein
LLLGGGSMFALNGYYVVRCLGSKSWPSTQATVKESGTTTSTSRTAQGRTMFTQGAYVQYVYYVDGVEYTCNHVEFGEEQRFRAGAEAVCARYTVGKTVPAYYDPSSPRDAVLERTLTFSTFIWLALTLAGGYVGVRLIFVGLTPHARAATARFAPWSLGFVPTDYVVAVPGVCGLALVLMQGLGV